MNQKFVCPEEPSAVDSIFDMISRSADKDPKAPVFRYFREGEIVEVYRSEFMRDVQNAGNGYLRYAGKNAVILAVNSYNYIVNCLGALSAGCNIALLDLSWGEEDVCRAIERTDSSLVLYDIETEEMFENLSQKFPNAESRNITERFANVNDLTERTDTEGSERREGELMVFTSGTSGRAKIAVTPLRSMMGHILCNRNRYYFETGEWWAIPVPFHHSFGMNMLLAALAKDTPLLISSMRYIERDLKMCEVTGIFAVPHLINHLLKRGNSLKKVKKLLSGGGRCSEQLEQSCLEQGIRIQNIYGSSELTANAAMSQPGNPVEEIYFHEGVHPFLNQAGELVIQTDYHMKEYLNMLDETEQVLREDGLHTGDAAIQEANGAFRIMGRIAEVIVMENGEKLSIAETEESLGNIPGVREAAVILLNNRLTAIFVAENAEDEALIRKAVEDYNREKSYAMRIRDVRFHQGAFPRTASGKLLRRLLQK